MYYMHIVFNIHIKLRKKLKISIEEINHSFNFLYTRNIVMSKYACCSGECWLNNYRHLLSCE